MGINPRGMVPVLVIDGAVHIDSNDIIETLERRFPEPTLWPLERAAEIRSKLKAEDNLHHDLRVLSFRFVHSRAGTTKTAELLESLRKSMVSASATNLYRSREQNCRCEEVRVNSVPVGFL
jgi:glutathione S-transferase